MPTITAAHIPALTMFPSRRFTNCCEVTIFLANDELLFNIRHENTLLQTKQICTWHSFSFGDPRAPNYAEYYA